MKKRKCKGGANVNSVFCRTYQSNKFTALHTTALLTIEKKSETKFGELCENFWLLFMFVETNYKTEGNRGGGRGGERGAKGRRKRKKRRGKEEGGE